MNKNFQSLGRFGALQQVMGLSNKEIADLRKIKKMYLTAPMDRSNSDEYLPRELQYNYLSYAWFCNSIRDYDHFMTSLWESWCYARNSRLQVVDGSASLTTNVSSFFTDLRVNSHRLLNFQPVRWKSPPVFLSDLGVSIALVRVATMNDSRVNPRNTYGTPSARRDDRRDSMVFSSYDDFRTRHGTTYYIFIAGRESKLVKCFRFKRHVFNPHGKISQAEEYATLDAEELKDAACNVVSAQCTFVRAELPKGYDDNYNLQTWIPLTTKGGLFFDSNNTCFRRDTSYVWAVDNHVDFYMSPSSSTSRVKTRWLGSANSEVFPKDDLSSYELTTNERHLGKGKIFVDSGDVCYCPHSGFPLVCSFKPGHE